MSIGSAIKSSVICSCCSSITALLLIFGSIGLFIAGVVCKTNMNLCQTTEQGNIAMIVVGVILTVLSCCCLGLSCYSLKKMNEAFNW